MHTARFAVAAVLVAAMLPACIGETPEEAARAAQGDAPDGDEEHRPGQPCLVCHSADYNPGGAVFVLAGTVYLDASDDDGAGLEGAEVSFIDADGHEFSSMTNRVGNFMIRVDTSLEEPRRRSRGRAEIPWEPTFPLDVAVVYLGEEKSMESKIWREGSCAGCHRTSELGVDHVQKVYYAEGAL